LVYIWADGVHSGLRGEDDKLCALVIVGVTARGKKRFLAIEDGVCESTQSPLSHMQACVAGQRDAKFC
jgi:putative transposase